MAIDYKIGDAIEVCEVENVSGQPVVRWLPATVQFADAFQVVAVLSDSSRRALKPLHVRRARAAGIEMKER